MAKAQILIVEDDHDLREALVTTLELAKFRVREASNANEALQRLAESRLIWWSAMSICRACLGMSCCPRSSGCIRACQ